MTRMECGEVRDLLHPYSDHELPTEEHRAVATHVAHCRECAEAAGQLEALRQRVRKAGTYAVPPALEQRLRSAIGSEHYQLSRPRHLRWALLAASHLLALLLGGLAAYGLWSRDDGRERLIRDAVAAHVRAFLVDQPVQIASADTHTVKPWFVGRLPFAPEVRDLSAQDFPLLGARVEYLMERPAAALVYGRRKHRINLFVLPSNQVSGPAAFEATRNGYNILAWPQGGFVNFAVSDLNRDELRQFAQLLRTR